jgi:hypothetical protein
MRAKKENQMKKHGIEMSDGIFTVWDTGFEFLVAPEYQEYHPHINASVLISARKGFPTTSKYVDGVKDGIGRQFRKAWRYANRLNKQFSPAVFPTPGTSNTAGNLSTGGK